MLAAGQLSRAGGGVKSLTGDKVGGSANEARQTLNDAPDEGEDSVEDGVDDVEEGLDDGQDGLQDPLVDQLEWADGGLKRVRSGERAGCGVKGQGVGLPGLCGTVLR